MDKIDHIHRLATARKITERNSRASLDRPRRRKRFKVEHESALDHQAGVILTLAYWEDRP